MKPSSAVIVACSTGWISVLFAQLPLSIAIGSAMSFEGQYLITSLSTSKIMFVTATSNMPAVREGIYEITDSVSGQYLNSIQAEVYNRSCDDALILQDRPTRLGKWEIERIGQGYTIKQVASGLYCALTDGGQLLSQSVMLSSVPTVWSITYEDPASQAVWIRWSVSDLCWDTPPSGHGRLISMGKYPAEPSEKESKPMTWCLRPTGSGSVSGSIPPGVYAIQNKSSDTFVSLSPDESTVSCWPDSDLAKTGVKLWEIVPHGAGYTIRLQGTDKYCTLQSGVSNRTRVTVSKVPAAWKIVVSDSPVHAGGGYVQIFWADTQFCWELANKGKTTPDNPIEIAQVKEYQSSRIFKLIA